MVKFLGEVIWDMLTDDDGEGQMVLVLTLMIFGVPVVAVAVELAKLFGGAA